MKGIKMEKIYKIEIEETSQKVIEIKANNLEEAISKVQERYDNEEIVLDENDYKDVKFTEYEPPKRIYEKER